MFSNKHTSTSDHGFCSSSFQVIWTTIHMISLDFPVKPTAEEREDYTTWFLLLRKVLPCSICRKNLVLNLQELKFNPRLHMQSRDTFAEFAWNLHNYINTKLNKNVFMPWDEFNQFYEQLRASDCSAESCTIGSKDPRCL